ncbi:MAG: amidase [Rhodospirillaceae bacterium]|nr:amidase [Rhodospirillaceae bacterium]
MVDDLIKLTATDAIGYLKAGDISPLEMIAAAEKRIELVEPFINALPTTCFERARRCAKRLMSGDNSNMLAEPGWLAGIPIAIKDLMDVSGVRTTYGSTIFANHVPKKSHPLVERIERMGGIVIAKSNTPEFGAGGATFNQVFGKTCNPWNTSLTSGGSTGGGAAALASGEIWLAHGSDHGGSLRRPATYCSVVGLRPSPGRITRGSVDSLFSPLTVQGPMARNIRDLALFLDTMTGLCPLDPLTFDAPRVSFTDSLLHPSVPRRIAYTDTIGGSPVDRETVEITRSAMRHFRSFGAEVDEISIDIADLEETFLALRSQQFVIDRELQLKEYRHQIKADIIWNTELGLKQTTSDLARAERARREIYVLFSNLFNEYDIIVTPGANTPAFDVNLRHPTAIDGVKLKHYMAASMLTGAITLCSLPALAIPCGFDKHGRPVGLQMVGPPRGEVTLLTAGVLYEEKTGLSNQLPVEPKPGQVPPSV